MKKIIITETQLKKLVSEDIDFKLYHNTFSSAVQFARNEAENRGYELVENDWWTNVNMGKGKPKEGETTRATIGLTKNGKPQRKALHIQVYNRGNDIKYNYELNYYIS